MFKNIIEKFSIKPIATLVVGIMVTGCVVSFSPPELSDNFPKKFDHVPVAKALPSSMNINTKDTFNTQGSFEQVLQSSSKIGIARFNIHFVTEDRASASTGDGGVVVMDIALGGVSKAQMQAITNAAYADFIAQLQAAGREVVPVANIRATSGYRGIHFDGPSGTSWNTGMDLQVLTDQEKTIMRTFWASGLPGWHIDPLGVGNQAVFPWISGELRAAVITVDMTVSFVTLSSSGRGSSWFGSDASVSAKPNLKITAVRYDGHFTNNPPGGDMGSLVQDNDQPIIIGAYKASVKKANSSSRKIGRSRTNTSSQTIVANSRDFRAKVLKGIQASNAAFIRFTNDHKPSL